MAVRMVSHHHGVRILPLGTRIAIDWSTNPTFGYNIPKFGDDSSLISKTDLKCLVEKVIQGFSEKVRFIKHFGEGVEEETVVDVVSVV